MSGPAQRDTYIAGKIMGRAEAESLVRRLRERLFETAQVLHRNTCMKAGTVSAMGDFRECDNYQCRRNNGMVAEADAYLSARKEANDG